MCYAEGEYFDTTNPTVDNNGLLRDAYGKAVKIGTRHQSFCDVSLSTGDDQLGRDAILLQT